MATGPSIGQELQKPISDSLPMSVNLSDSRFREAHEARQWFETQRWPHGVICPHCGNSDQIKITLLQGKSHRPGLYECAQCHQQFTVTVGTVMHRSKIPLNKWLIAMQLIVASERGVSARQLRQMLGISYQSAWHVSHRIRKLIGDGVAQHRQGDARGSEQGPNVSASKLLVRGKTARKPRSVKAAARRPSQRPRKIS
jgi:transposase-like protein